MFRATVTSISLLSLCGCMDSLESQTKSKGGIIGKKTQDIAEFDPAAGQAVKKKEFKVDDPILYGAQAYRPIIEQTSKLQIQHAVNLFHGFEGRYPKDHKEFMEKVIKANSIQLPSLGSRFAYQYDVKNHELVIVAVQPREADGK